MREQAMTRMGQVSTKTITTGEMERDRRRKAYTTDATALGLRPGRWPDSLTVVSSVTGGKRVFLHDGQEQDDDGETVAVRYASGGLTVRVVNR